MSDKGKGPSPYMKGMVMGAWYMAMLVLILDGVFR